MSKVVLASETTTALSRTTVHTQYEGKAFGLYILSRFIPFTFYIRQPAKRHVRAIIVFGSTAHVRNMRKDFGVVEKRYQKVYTFNIRHYLRCYLPNVVGNGGTITTPYTYNLCVYCGAAIEDGHGNLIGEIIHRKYRPDKYVWKPNKTLQDDAGADEVFTPREGVI